ncbi:MAG: polysulfide reductase NrfD [Chloroflexi bacterium]|nr:polysulfide reductase NrfD [Chloroflexota bacterium]
MEEPIHVLFNASHQIPFGPAIAIYFFFTGISAACFLISTVGYVLRVQRYQPLARLAALLAPIFLLAAPWFLLSDLEQPLRFIHLFWMWNFRSPITWGTIILTVYPTVALIYLWHILNKNLRWARIFGIIGIHLAVGLELYTGFILAMGMGRPMWNTALMPLYFLVSALVSGAGILILLAIVKEKVFGNNLKVTVYLPTIDLSMVRELGLLLLIFIMLDLTMTISEVIVMANSRPAEQAVAMQMLQGDFSSLFLGVQVLVGLLIPLALLSFPSVRRSNTVLAIASGLVLVGVFMMRYVTVIAGQMIPLN